MQTDARDEENLPAGHVEQLVLRATEYCPAEHPSHAVALLFCPVADPAGQLMHRWGWTDGAYLP